MGGVVPGRVRGKRLGVGGAGNQEWVEICSVRAMSSRVLIILPPPDPACPATQQVSGFLKRHMPVALAEQLGEAPTPTSLDASFSSTAASASRTPRGASSSGSGNASSNGSSGGAAAAADTAAALSTTFLQLDARLAVEPGLSVQYSGSTAVVCMLQGRRLTTAWVGDSKAVLARQDPRGVRAIPLTRDHKPNHPDERTRITAAGGRVERCAY